MPWAEWDTKAPVDRCTVHLSKKQIDPLWQAAAQKSSLLISKHDALLAHVWSCVVRARGLQADRNPVHCYLALGARRAFQLDDSVMGSPIMMLNVEMAASTVASGVLGPIAHRIRETISTVNDPRRLAAYFHSIAYETSPQRLWRYFLCQKHIRVTTWARAGMYDIDFGLGSRTRYADGVVPCDMGSGADGVVPCVDGCILILDSPPTETTLSSAARGWTENGIDITLNLRCEDMERFLRDPLLLPRV